ncbi:MAG: type II toxin-antitoxin system VapC family toxin [Rhodospirillaceae bacterium]|nr:type II toxin-antitoxin system VapC family toxin [Rhodospirillaceae bacterium]
MELPHGFWCSRFLYNVPAAVWNYRLGGYQVLKKWPSCRKHDVLGTQLRSDEIQHFIEASPVKPLAYIETSVVSYLTARQSRDVVVAAYQEMTREWWRTASDRFDLVASELVVTESEAGDADAASARLEVLKPVTLLNITENSEALTRVLLDLGAVPHQAAADAAHIAIAVTNGVDYLVTWNFKHIANAAMRARIERVCRRTGYEPPVICSPNELMESEHADDTT